MSDQQSVWPDGARAAVKSANEHRRLEHFMTGGYDRWADGILTALEPFVQQRIEKATEWIDLDRQAACRSFQECEAKLHEAETRNGITGGVYTELYALRAEVARLREDGERYEAVLRLLAVDVLYCHRGDDGVVTAFINLNDYFIPAADGEAIAMNDAPALAALYDQGGWPAISQWVADRRGIPNQHWRKRLDAARSARGEGA